MSLTFPGALTTAQAASIAERRLFLEWMNRDRLSIQVDWGHLRLDPGDVGTAAKGGATFTIEIEEIDFGADGVIRMRALSDDAVVHSSTESGASALGVPAQSIVLSGPSALYLIDTPLLRDADDGLGFYIASGSFGAGPWPGASIFKSNDGETFATPFSAAVSARNVSHGAAVAVLADAGSRTWDRTNSVTVKMFRGSLASDTELNVLNGANALLIGDEIVQFVTASLNSDGGYSLSGLLRGRRGTDWASASHAAGDRVVVLSASTVLREALPDTDLNAQRWYKAVTVGGSLAGATRASIAFLGRSQMPYAPVDIRGTREGSPQDWTIIGKRRSRVFGAWRDGMEVPLAEASESYELHVLNAAGSPTDNVVRVLTSAALEFVYTQTQQIIDFGAVQTGLTVKVYQLSDTVGRGFAARAVLEDGKTLSWMAEAD